MLNKKTNKEIKGTYYAKVNTTNRKILSNSRIILFVPKNLDSKRTLKQKLDNKHVYNWQPSLEPSNFAKPQKCFYVKL